MIVIVGESASGKSTIANYLANNYGYKKIVTYTTREPRSNEKDGVDYYFVTDKQFKKMQYEGYFAETAEYNGWLYGSSKNDYEDNAVVILTPKGLRSIKRKGIKNIVSFYIDVPRRDRLIKCLMRGDNIEEAYRRNLSDVGQFDGIEDEVDFVFTNPNYCVPVDFIANKMHLKNMTMLYGCADAKEGFEDEGI